MNTKVALLILAITCAWPAWSQTNESPEELYDWKNAKNTNPQPGYVVLKSGKRLSGSVSLKGSYVSVEEVRFQGDGKDISFPVKALRAYGLDAKASAKQQATTSGPINESAEGLYEWRNGGVVMNKQVMNSVPREGYVILTSGKRFEGELRVQKRDEELWNFQVKTADSKDKFKADEVSKFGLNVSASEVKQANLAKTDATYFPGTVTTSSGEKIGEVAIVKTSFYSEKILFKSDSGEFSEFTPSSASAFTQEKDGATIKYASIEGAFLEDEFDGSTFRLYRNPKPTTINKFATGLVKTGVEAGTQAAASEISYRDEKKNDYVSNLDSVIRVSDKAQLVELRDKLVQLGGYSSVDEMNDRSDNESLKNNVNAIELAIAGKEFSESDQGIYNQEWIILNKGTEEKTVVYKGDFNELIEPLLFGCYEYLSLEKSDQKEFQKWKNLKSTVEYLDKCY